MWSSKCKKSKKNEKKKIRKRASSQPQCSAGCPTREVAQCGLAWPGLHRGKFILYWTSCLRSQADQDYNEQGAPATFLTKI